MRRMTCGPCQVIGYYDPINLAEWNLYGKGDDATVGFLRHAEIKHGRVAMAAFVGYCVQANGLKFPWEPFTSISATSPPEQWDALPEAAKWQIILFIGVLEFFGEWSPTTYLGSDGLTKSSSHYMRDGRPGEYPKWGGFQMSPLQLYDPFGFSKNKSAEKKSEGLLKEINNGRLAMIGIMGFLAESKVPGSVPALAAMQGTKSEIPYYAGDFMAPFAKNFHLFGDAWLQTYYGA